MWKDLLFSGNGSSKGHYLKKKINLIKMHLWSTDDAIKRVIFNFHTEIVTYLHMLWGIKSFISVIDLHSM